MRSKKRCKKKIFKRKSLKKMRGGKSKSQKEQVINNVYSKSELKQKVKSSKKMNYLKLIIPTMNILEKQMNEQVKTFTKLNKLLGEYFTQ